MNGPNNERSTAVANNSTLAILTLFGNLGGNPEVHRIPEQTGTRHEYDPVTDQVVEKPFTRQAREFRTFSLAVSTKEMEEPRWIRCVDWKNDSRLFQKGDRVRLTGSFQVRTYEKDGETRRVRQFVIKTANLESAKIRQDEAA
jgi:single-stranded DNA-binding protein